MAPAALERSEARHRRKDRRMHSNANADRVNPQTIPTEDSDILPTRVIHVSEMSEFLYPVYIGRANGRARLKGSKWANPFKVADVGTNREAVILYEQHLVKSPHLWAQLPELRGAALACWCRRSTETRTKHNCCHGDVLANLLNNHTDDELREMAVTE